MASLTRIRTVRFLHRSFEHTHAFATLAMCCLVLVAALAPTAAAQLVPERTYYGVDRRMPMSVHAPEGFAGGVTIKLHEPVTAEVVDEVTAAAGRVDLAALFASLWRSEDPHVLYAQLYLDGVATGPAVVLQPMLSPDYAHNVDPRTLTPTFGQGRPVFNSERIETLIENGLASPQQRPEPVLSGMRAYVDSHVVFETTLGEVEFRMRPDVASNTVWNFLSLTDGGFYTDILFHRIVKSVRTRDGSEQPFVVQVGDPTGTGAGGPGYMVDLEKSTLPHDFGVLSMARSGDPNSNGSQVFICLSRAATQPLDGLYTAFAYAVRGGDTIEALAGVDVDQSDRPVDPGPRLISAKLVDAPPATAWPDPVEAPQRPYVDR